MSRVLRVVGFAALVAAATALAGWWTVPLLAVVWSRVVARERRPALAGMLGAALGWGFLLGWAAYRGPVELVALRAGGVFNLPAWGFVLATLVFPALLAGTAVLATRPSPGP